MMADFPTACRRSRVVDCRRLATCAAVGWLVLTVPCEAVRRAEIRFTRTADLPAIGIRIPLMPDAKEMPVTPPSAVTYTFTRENGTSWKSEMFPPSELWRQAQQAGCWTDEYKNTVTIGTMTIPLPKGFKQQHATKEEFDSAVAALQKQPPVWTVESLAQWVADFVGIAQAPGQVVPKHAGNVSDVARAMGKARPQIHRWLRRLRIAPTVFRR